MKEMTEYLIKLHYLCSYMSSINITKKPPASFNLELVYIFITNYQTIKMLIKIYLRCRKLVKTIYN